VYNPIVIDINDSNPINKVQSSEFYILSKKKR